MSIHVHITNIVNDTHKRFGFIMRNSEHLNDTYVISLLFNDIVRSKLEYDSSIWSPVGLHKSYQNQIQQIQNTSTFQDQGIW
jgi:hypothetical protein